MDAHVIADLNRRFAHHPPKTSEVGQLHSSARQVLHGAAVQIATLVPPGREQSTALTKLEEAMFWANAGIARIHSAAPLEAQGLQPAIVGGFPPSDSPSTSDPAPTALNVSNPVPG